MWLAVLLASKHGNDSVDRAAGEPGALGPHFLPGGEQWVGLRNGQQRAPFAGSKSQRFPKISTSRPAGPQGLWSSRSLAHLAGPQGRWPSSLVLKVPLQSQALLCGDAPDTWSCPPSSVPASMV